MESQAGAAVDTRGLSICETCTKQVSIPAFESEKIMYSAWNSAKTDIGRHFQAMFHITISSLTYLSAKYTFFHIGEKRIGTSEDTSNPTPNEERQLTTHHEDVDADVQKMLGKVVEMVSTTGDVDVVEEETHFSSASAQILIREIMVCNRDLEQMKQNIKDVQKILSNIINILGKI
ncbi:hypothetical protein AB205_0147130 [Aquarana catesbeiana]|uniref:Uncharacterized protein n=1 Tax=Aquarana catesbeiana TaxID=8400 RepID=A0A2G9RIM2_AQUCT|nr:hypothetical protein AB205_0147130 [Aquarana catesbeiana]